MAACQQYDMPEPPTFDQPQTKDGMIQLGRRLQNPYTVENMREAYANLVSQGVLKSGLRIEATHHYIRVLPASEYELYDFENQLLQHLGEHDMELLEESISGHIYSHPLDYEIIGGGYYFYNPQLPPGGITWQYTVIPVGFTMLPVQHEVLADLFLKCDFAIAEKSSRGFDQASWQLLETEALKLAGDPYAEISGPVLKGTAWWPSGRITVFDNVLNQQIPLQGAKVRARRWFTTHVAISQPNGTFQMQRPFHRPANYSIVWERADWDIRLGNWGQAMFNGPKIRGVWNLDISTGRSLGLATVHRALYRYYFNDRLGLKAPFIAPFHRSRLKVGYFHDGHWTFDMKPSVGYAIPYWNLATFPHINISGVGRYGKLSTNRIFGMTINELAHVSHWELINDRLGLIANLAGVTGRGVFSLMWLNLVPPFKNTRIIVEGWSNVVDWELTNLEYYSLRNRFKPWARVYNHREGRQEWTPDDDPLGGNPLFIDLIDDYNQRFHLGGNRPNDNVRGFTISTLENNVLKYTFDFRSLRQQLKANKPAGVTDAEIDELIDFYENL
ncbi:MAG TPA: hypothetical protein DCM62_06255 [Bacteroidales bacterium]|nr:hypothetical protein [Bacteroidales bacterium]